jgi:predicted nucleic acid-binding protein
VNGRLLYLDSSALLKVVVSEPESQSLFTFLNDWPVRVSSELARTEVLRALRRAGAKVAQFRRGQRALERLGLIPIDTRVLTAAALLKPVLMRSLDAIHLATALSLGSELAGIVSYDDRLSQAAVHSRVRVWTPR